MAGMTEDTSQTTMPPAAEDTSLTQGNPALVTDQAPVNNTSQTNPQPPNATADDIPGTLPEVDGDAGRGVDTPEDKMAAYKAAKEKFFIGEKPPEETVVKPPVAETVVVPPAEDTAARLPKVPIRPVDQGDMDILQAYKAEGAGKTLRQFILEREAPPPAAPVVDGETVTAEALPDGTPVTRTFQSAGEVKAEIRRLLSLKNDALGNFNPKDARAFEEQVENLRDLLPTLAAAEQTAERVEQTAIQMVWQEDLTKAQQLFADAGQPGTPLELKAAEIRAQWVAEGHPLANEPRSAVAIYSEAAIALQVKPSAAPSAAPGKVVSTPPPASIHRPPVSLIAGGDARSQAPRAPAEITKENYAEAKAAYLKRTAPTR